MFRQARQMSTETLDQYPMRLIGLVKHCGLTELDFEISHIILTYSSASVRRKGLRDEKMSLKNLLEWARSTDIANSRATCIELIITTDQVNVN